MPGPARRRSNLVAYHVALALAAIVVAVILIKAGADREAEPSIAGGYDVERGADCLGARFDLRQSGRFVDLGNAERTLGGELQFENSRLTGDVQCVGGETAEIDARVRAGELAGRVGAQPVAATQTSGPPPPGAQQPRAPARVAGKYALLPSSACLGGSLTIEGGREITLKAGDRTVGRGRYADGNLTAAVTCLKGGRTAVTGQAAGRRIQLTLTASGERLVADLQREAGSRFAVFFLAVVVIMLFARLLGMAAVKLGQPRVMGEVVAGLALGPSLLGALFPAVRSALFPDDIVPFIGVVAQLGLAFYMFLVGLELDPKQLSGRARQVVAISNASVALPMLLGILIAVPAYELLGPDKGFPAFAIFMGISMSVTAFPVLARILVERRMLKRPVGAVALASAAVDDITAWFLIALATAVAAAGTATRAVETVVLAGVFTVVVLFGVRRVLARVSVAYDQAGRVPDGWIVLIFAGVLLCAYTTEEIGIALIFGAFLMGLAMPRHTGLTEDVTRRLEDFVGALLLPLFFAYTGLRLDIGLLGRPILWVFALVILLVAVAGKLVGALLAARATGFSWRDSTVIGTLMNTRGLTELIVLNLALEKGVISDALFAILVIMALVTTGMAGPLLNLLDPRRELGAPLEDEFGDARERSAAEYPELAVPQQSILVAPQADAALARLLTIAEPLAASVPPRELILTRLVRPPRGAAVRGGLQTENRLLAEAVGEVETARHTLIAKGIAARAVAFVSTDTGHDLARLARHENVALIVLDGRRPLLGEGVPRGDVGDVLRDAPCDVAVLADREGAPPGGDVVVPFGGHEHDWAALELGAWISSATGARLKLVGAADTPEGRARCTRLLGDAGLIVQQYAGVMADLVVTEPGRAGIEAAAASASLLVLGLSERWREEGLGPERSEIARSGPAPVLFVRRGARAGALAPRDDVTRFGWSSPGVGGFDGLART